MNKEDLKSLVEDFYNNLIDNIESQEDPNKLQVINYMQEAINSLRELEEGDTSSLEVTRHRFSNVYKEIAQKSLLSYKNTNDTFHSLTLKHKEELQNFQKENPLIDEKSLFEEFTNIQEKMLQEIKHANKVILELQSKVKELEETSTLDPLTKIFNKRSLDQHLESICDKDAIHHDMFLLIVDIDDFKQINDTYGHLAGDKVLIFLANLLRKTLRDGDKVFRFGGEEFVVILNRIDLKGCEQIANRLLVLISSNNLIYKGESLHITVSIGITNYRQNDTPEEIFNRADKALYVAKSNGKNTISMDIK